VLCLDFVNSGQRRGGADRLHGYADLVGWARAAGALDEAEARLLLREAARRPIAADAAFRRAVALREAIYRVLSASADRRLARNSDLAVLNGVIAQAGAAVHLAARHERLQWAWIRDRPALEQPLWLVARSAADVLTSGMLAAVRQCPAPDCGRLFLDRSRNRTRRWCDMRLCGNRAKARQHYARSRSRRARSAGGKS
jgi:predicted RNA-binding Zn ribbon-like protein